MVHSCAMTSSQPPGWYPDATLPGYERWWDGGAWSPVTRPIGDLGAPAPAAPAAPEAPSALVGDSDYGQSGGYSAPSAAPSYGQPEQQAPAAQSWGAPSEPAWGSPGEPAAPAPPAASPYEQPATPYGQQPATPYGQQPGLPYGQQPASPYGAPGGSPVAPPEYAAGTPYGAAPGGQPAPPPGGYPAYPQYPQGGGAYATPYAYPNGTDNLASRWARLFARIIDGILTGIVSTILGFPFLRQVIDAFTEYIESLPTDGSAAPDPTGLLTDGAVAGAILRLTIVAAVVGAAYHIVLIALRGATLGKSLLGIRVKPVDGDGNPSWAQAAMRWATTDVPGLIPNVGGLYSLLDSLWCLWDGRKQCLHDKLPKTIVVRSR